MAKMTKRERQAPRAPGKRTPDGWRRVEARGRLWWAPDAEPGDGVITDDVVQGTLVKIAKMRSKFSEDPRDVLVLALEDGRKVNVGARGNLKYLLEEANPGEGEELRIEYLGFTPPSRDLPMGRHEFDLLVRPA